MSKRTIDETTESGIAHKRTKQEGMKLERPANNVLMYMYIIRP